MSAALLWLASPLYGAMSWLSSDTDGDGVNDEASGILNKLFGWFGFFLVVVFVGIYFLTKEGFFRGLFAVIGDGLKWLVSLTKAVL